MKLIRERPSDIHRHPGPASDGFPNRHVLRTRWLTTTRPGPAQRWFAHNGYGVHGSGSAAARDVDAAAPPRAHSLPAADMADWTAALADAARCGEGRLSGHYMGSLIAAGDPPHAHGKKSPLFHMSERRQPDRGTDLLRPAEANDIEAVGLVSIWGLALQAEGRQSSAGLWMQAAPSVFGNRGPARRMLQRLIACNSYQNA